MLHSLAGTATAGYAAVASACHNRDDDDERSRIDRAALQCVITVAVNVHRLYIMLLGRGWQIIR